MNRAPADGIKFATPFGSMFLHVARKESCIINVQISHQMKDRAAPVAALIEAINVALGELVGRDAS